MTLRQHDVIRDSDDIEQAYDLCDNSENVLQRIGYEELLKQVASLPPGSQLQRARLMLQERLRKIR